MFHHSRTKDGSGAGICFVVQDEAHTPIKTEMVYKEEPTDPDDFLSFQNEIKSEIGNPEEEDEQTNSTSCNSSVLIKEEIEIADDCFYASEDDSTSLDPDMDMTVLQFVGLPEMYSFCDSQQGEVKQEDVEVINIDSDDCPDNDLPAEQSVPAAPILRRLLEEKPPSPPRCYCRQCGTFASTPAELESRCAWHTGARPHCCTLCNSAFASLAQLCAHSIAHSRGKPFPCLVCGGEISRLAHFRHHLSIHDNPDGGPPRQCPVCRRKFGGELQWQRHITRAHRKDRNRLTKMFSGVCRYCGRQFRNSGGMKRHELSCKSRSRGKQHEDGGDINSWHPT